MKIETLIKEINKKQIWDEKPVFCFTSDVDWASEDVMKEYFKAVIPMDIKPTLFVTHDSKVIQDNYKAGNIERGIHPNFLPGSSHGDSYLEVIKNCAEYAPETYGFRSHRAFEVTDTSHLMKNNFGFKYVSHQITIFQTHIKPILVESGLINFPVFFEDGTHLYNKLSLFIEKYLFLFKTPGIKIISFHPMNFVLNSPTLDYMRDIKDILTRSEYNNINTKLIGLLINQNTGIRNTTLDIINFVKENNYPIYSMNELYNLIVE
jgi:hypothetical protein